ncbi:unnamed protein product [Symbiodinium natans]|uniref:Uncharacterized protein n=1 Tax=Symbiodinium natans TaxID=878477 RepID=A0A812LRP7_9DINO|nr:unnamed protein product [Symbiodinium natans]
MVSAQRKVSLIPRLRLATYARNMKKLRDPRWMSKSGAFTGNLSHFRRHAFPVLLEHNLLCVFDALRRAKTQVSFDLATKLFELHMPQTIHCHYFLGKQHMRKVLRERFDVIISGPLPKDFAKLVGRCYPDIVSTHLTVVAL